MIDTVIFDAMGVIFVDGDDTNELLVPYVKKINKNITTQEIVRLYLQASLGEISAQDFWKSVGVEEKDIISKRNYYLDNCLSLDTDIIKVFSKLKDLGYKIGILSNDVGEWSRYLREKYSLDKYIDYCIISSEVSMRKPDKHIYEYAVEKYKLNPSRCVFIDDRIKNLYPAKEVGFNIILFDRENCAGADSDLDIVKHSRDIIDVLGQINERKTR
ncbi:MAG: HAD-IA family hydrolase [Clostridia bacterium]|nr:HAD-IA family hydrolase [Clostridia bacterium]